MRQRDSEYGDQQSNNSEADIYGAEDEEAVHINKKNPKIAVDNFEIDNIRKSQTIYHKKTQKTEGLIKTTEPPVRSGIGGGLKQPTTIRPQQTV